MNLEAPEKDPEIDIDHVGLSSDIMNHSFSLDGWRDASETRNVTLELVQRGYAAEEIGKIWSGNALRVWSEVEGAAAQLQRRMSRESQVGLGAGARPLTGEVGVGVGRKSLRLPALSSGLRDLQSRGQGEGILSLVTMNT